MSIRIIAYSFTTQDACAVSHMTQSTNATYPDDPLLTMGVMSIMVDKVVAAIIYDKTLF